jgi:hypothetical protein
MDSGVRGQGARGLSYAVVSELIFSSEILPRTLTYKISKMSCAPSVALPADCSLLLP